MQSWLKKIKFWLLAIALCAIVLACNRPAPPQGADSTGAPQGNCRSLLHDGGETEICGQPRSVVALSPPLLDILLSLGVQPAGYAEVDLINRQTFDNPGQQIPYLGDRVTTQPVNLGDRHNPSIETLLRLKPDLVLGETFYVQNNYSTLSRIAPTAYFDTGAEVGWQPALAAIAQGLSREAQAQQVIAAHNQQVEAVKNQLAPLISGQSIIVLGWQGIVNQSFVFAGDFTTELLEDLGFQVILGPSDRPSTSMEAIAQINADHILVMPSGENTVENAKQQWQNNPILQALPAVQAGHLYFMDYQLTRIRGPIAAEIFLNEFAAQVTQQPS